MEERELEFQGMEGQLPWPGPQSTDSELGDDWLPMQWPPNPEDHFSHVRQSFDVNPGLFGFIGTPDLQFSNFIAGYPEDPTLMFMGASDFTSMSAYGLEGLLGDSYSGIENFNIGDFTATSSSTMSEAFSPSSEFVAPSMPTSPISHLQSHLYSDPDGPINSNATLDPPAEDPGAITELRLSDPQRQYLGRIGQVGYPRISARKRRMIERPVKCDFCDKGFPFKADLKKHVAARHTAKKDTYQCPECPKKYTREDRVIRHRRQKHDWLPSDDKRRRTKTVDEGECQQQEVG